MFIFKFLFLLFRLKYTFYLQLMMLLERNVLFCIVLLVIINYISTERFCSPSKRLLVRREQINALDLSISGNILKIWASLDEKNFTIFFLNKVKRKSDFKIFLWENKARCSHFLLHIYVFCRVHLHWHKLKKSNNIENSLILV